jgi:XTP/dITP diphosphohydrolase
MTLQYITQPKQKQSLKTISVVKDLLRKECGIAVVTLDTGNPTHFPTITISQEMSEAPFKTDLHYTYLDETREFRSISDDSQQGIRDVVLQLAVSIRDDQIKDEKFYSDMAARWDSRAKTWSSDITDKTHYVNHENGYDRFNKLMGNVLPMIKTGPVLDYGCGSGDVSEQIRAAVPNAIRAIDVSANMAAEYNAKKISNATAISGLIDDLKLDKYALIVTRGIVISHTPKHQIVGTLQALAHSVAEGGYLVIDFLQDIENGREFVPLGGKVELSPAFLDGFMHELGLTRIDASGDSHSRVVVHTYHRLANNQIYFATSNPLKIKELNAALSGGKLEVVMCNFDLPEIQSSEVSEVVEHKAKQAYDLLQKPVICTDGGIFIDTLKGFPGVYSKFAMQTIGAEGILALMNRKSDRNAQRINALSYFDGTKHHTRVSKIELTVLTDMRDKLYDSYPMDRILVPKSDKQGRAYCEIDPSERSRYTELVDFVTGLAKKK